MKSALSKLILHDKQQLKGFDQQHKHKKKMLHALTRAQHVHLHSKSELQIL